MSEHGSAADDPFVRFRPQILAIDDLEHPPEPIVQIAIEERFRNIPTRSILDYLDMCVLVPEARPAALAEPARRGVPPPTH
jgi:hypothetical protein